MAMATVRARPSTTGSPQPQIPSSVLIFKKHQRGLMKYVSIAVIFMLSPPVLSISAFFYSNSFCASTGSREPPSMYRVVPVM